jgi:hypothetical protein
MFTIVHSDNKTVSVPASVAASLTRLVSPLETPVFHGARHVDVLEDIVAGRFNIGSFESGRFVLNVHYDRTTPVSAEEYAGLEHWGFDSHLIGVLRAYDRVLSVKMTDTFHVPYALNTIAIYMRCVSDYADRLIALGYYTVQALYAYRTPIEFPAEVHPEISRRIDLLIAERAEQKARDEETLKFLSEFTV